MSSPAHLQQWAAARIRELDPGAPQLVDASPARCWEFLFARVVWSYLGAIKQRRLDYLRGTRAMIYAYQGCDICNGSGWDPQPEVGLCVCAHVRILPSNQIRRRAAPSKPGKRHGRRRKRR